VPALSVAALVLTSYKEVNEVTDGVVDARAQVGSVGEPTGAVTAGYAGATTDTGHVGSSGSFGMLRPGVPDTQLQTDFGWRSEHMMAVVGLPPYLPACLLRCGVVLHACLLTTAHVGTLCRTKPPYVHMFDSSA
jgi:hypothetical protein